MDRRKHNKLQRQSARLHHRNVVTFAQFVHKLNNRLCAIQGTAQLALPFSLFGDINSSLQKPLTLATPTSLSIATNFTSNHFMLLSRYLYSPSLLVSALIETHSQASSNLIENLSHPTPNSLSTHSSPSQLTTQSAHFQSHSTHHQHHQTYSQPHLREQRTPAHLFRVTRPCEFFCKFAKSCILRQLYRGG